MQLLKKIVSSVLKKANRGIYNTATSKVYNPQTHMAISLEQAYHDPAIRGLYDLKTQMIVPKESLPSPLHNFDLFTSRAQHWKATAGKALGNVEDRYETILNFLPNGSGICLDACTASPRNHTIETVQNKGYHYQAIDIHGDGIAALKEDLTKLTFESNSVPVIMSLDTLEHIDDWPQAVREMHRVLVPNGFLLVNVPCYYFEKKTGEPIRPGVDPWGHTRYFSAYEFIDEFAKAGFLFLRIQFQFDIGSLVVAMVKPTP